MFLCSLTGAYADAPNEAAKQLPDRVGDFRAQGVSRMIGAQDYNALAAATREYQSPKGERISVTLIKTRSDSSAYALLTSLLYKPDANTIAELVVKSSSEGFKVGEIGTASFSSPDSVHFFKGTNSVAVSNPDKQLAVESITAFARLLAQTIESEDNDVPVLVKHLPDWEAAQAHAAYAVSLVSLKNILRDQPVLDAIDFAGGTEAVVAPYDSAQLAILEYTTPQIAADNDARIKERISKLSSEGQPLPSAYRRVGNYSVFVFNAPDAKSAEDLLGRVHYEKVVQWLGDNPRALQRAQREYAATTAGMILAVLKASGLALILCLSTGGLFGSIIFLRRRAQQSANSAYTDAGGLMRLNIDEMTPQPANPARLLGDGNK
ncbi:MAG: hypothetical protein ABR577_11165 [Pyrinomonadaceae bacterium]